MQALGFRCSWIVLLAALMTGCGGSKAVPATGAPLTPVTGQEVKRLVLQPGAKAVLVNMWASWCGPCREEFPDLLKVRREYQDRGLRVVLVSWDAQPEDARKFLAAKGVDFPTYLKASGESDSQFIDETEPKWTGVFPTTFIYDGQGKLQYLLEGEQSYTQFAENVQNVLNHATGGKS